MVWISLPVSARSSSSLQGFKRVVHELLDLFLSFMLDVHYIIAIFSFFLGLF
jgi:hypothetical protein